MIFRRFGLALALLAGLIVPASALTQGQRTAVLSSAPGRAPIAPPLYSNLAAYYRFDNPGNAAGSMVLSSGNVTQANDLGPNGNNAPVSGTLAFNNNAGDTTGLKGSVRFDGAGEYITVPTAVSLSRQASAVFIWYKINGVPGTYSALFTQPATTGPSYALLIDNNLVQGVWIAAETALGFGFSNSFVASDMIGAASNAYSGIGADLYTKGSAFTSGTATGGRIGLWTGSSFPLSADVQAVLIYNVAPTLTQRTSILAWGNEQFNSVQTNTKTFVVGSGDSRTLGTGSTDAFNYSFPAQGSRQFNPRPFKMYNGGIGGAQLSANVAQTPIIAALNNNANYTNRLVTFFWGINDIGSGGQTSTQVIASITTAVANLRAGASGCKIIGMTVPPSGSLNSTQLGYLATVNAWIVANTVGFDAVVDVEGNPDFQNPANTLYFNADELHFTNLGYSIIAQMVDASITTNGWAP